MVGVDEGESRGCEWLHEQKEEDGVHDSAKNRRGPVAAGICLGPKRGKAWGSLLAVRPPPPIVRLALSRDRPRPWAPARRPTSRQGRSRTQRRPFCAIPDDYDHLSRLRLL